MRFGIFWDLRTWDLEFFRVSLTSMKKILLTASLLLTACANTEGVSDKSGSYPKGNANSSIVVEEFGDLQCPACRGAHTQIIKPLLETQGQNIRLVFRHFPLRQIHPFAQEAAEGAECAADQKKFWEYIDDNYAFQEKLSRDDILARAEKIGVEDMDLFTRCIKSRIKRDIIQADYDEGRKRGVSGTPTFFVMGERVPRNTIEEITKMIEEKVESQRL
jgi:protein-disulfide isomerase